MQPFQMAYFEFFSQIILFVSCFVEFLGAANRERLHLGSCKTQLTV